MKLAYCKDCQTVIASGDLPEKVRKIVKGKWTDIAPVYSHSVDGQVHVARLIEVPATPSAPGEVPGAYLKRLGKAHKAVLK
jgi:hypothetical protein